MSPLAWHDQCAHLSNFSGGVSVAARDGMGVEEIIEELKFTKDARESEESVASQTVRMRTRGEFEKLMSSIAPSTSRYRSMHNALVRSSTNPFYVDETNIKYCLFNPACSLPGGGGGSSKSVDQGESKQTGGADRLEARAKWRKDEYGFGIATALILYNATGKKITKFASGTFLNGVWEEHTADTIDSQERVFGFQRKANGEARGSAGYVVYRVENARGNPYNAVVAFYTAWSTDAAAPGRYVFVDVCAANTMTEGLEVEKIVSNGSDSVHHVQNPASSGISVHAEIGGGNKYKPTIYATISAPPPSSSSS